ncbi:hypothetical protein BKA69DRAFT_1037356 [Paraphysoderma sedebokerense]|nr:hypothetical protein BKA69DRAFT_1037356 [Paraphysoderma sedebokerense]
MSLLQLNPTTYASTVRNRTDHSSRSSSATNMLAHPGHSFPTNINESEDTTGLTSSLTNNRTKNVIWKKRRHTNLTSARMSSFRTTEINFPQINLIWKIGNVDGVDKAVKEMDKTFVILYPDISFFWIGFPSINLDTNFYNWIRDSHNASYIGIRLRALISEYDTNTILNGLKWLVQDWSISRKHELLTTLGEDMDQAQRDKLWHDLVNLEQDSTSSLPSPPSDSLASTTGSRLRETTISQTDERPHRRLRRHRSNTSGVFLLEPVTVPLSANSNSYLQVSSFSPSISVPTESAPPTHHQHFPPSRTSSFGSHHTSVCCTDCSECAELYDMDLDFNDYLNQLDDGLETDISSTTSSNSLPAHCRHNHPQHMSEQHQHQDDGMSVDEELLDRHVANLRQNGNNACFCRTSDESASCICVLDYYDMNMEFGDMDEDGETGSPFGSKKASPSLPRREMSSVN